MQNSLPKGSELSGYENPKALLLDALVIKAEESKARREHELNHLQKTLRYTSAISKYIKDNDEKAQAVRVVLALAQGPKGVAQAMVFGALEQTSFAEELQARLGEIQERLGKAIAERMEGKDTLDLNVESDRYLVGGGELIAAILAGGVPGRKGHGVVEGGKKPAVSKVESGPGQGAKGSTSINSVPRNANDLVGGPLENATQVSGRFKHDGGPANGTVYRADNQGNITSYAVYDSAGMIVKRVDVTGKAHANVSTPHVIEYGRNTLPDGTVRVQSPSTKLAPRPTTPDEIP
ncbi:hypothetical protein D3C77_343160 [compost metagenome]